METLSIVVVYICRYILHFQDDHKPGNGRKKCIISFLREAQTSYLKINTNKIGKLFQKYIFEDKFL